MHACFSVVVLCVVEFLTIDDSTYIQVILLVGRFCHTILHRELSE